jgi:hypothetical protein
LRPWSEWTPRRSVLGCKRCCQSSGACSAKHKRKFGGSASTTDASSCDSDGVLSATSRKDYRNQIHCSLEQLTTRR